MGAILVIFVAIVALYAHTLNVPWYFDDFAAIVNNPSVHDLSLAWREIGRQRWVAMVTFALNYWSGGQQVAGYHVANITIHLLTSCIAYLLLKRVFRGRTELALFGTLLFAVHPLQTQTVTYIVQRMAGLCGLFFLGALYLFVRGREILARGAPFRSSRHLACYGGALVVATLAAFTKENAIVLPFALLFFGRYFPSATENAPLPLRYVAPFLLVPVLLTIQALFLPLAGGDDFARLSGFYRHGTSSPLRYLVTEFSVVWLYLRLLILPYGQALDYGFPLVQELVTLRNVAAFAGLAGLIATSWGLRRRQPLISFGIAWFFLTLAVESSIIPLDPIFEHRLYLPIFGFAVVVTALLRWISAERLRHGLMAVIFVVLALLTWQRNQLWNDPFAFYEDNLRHAPQAQIAWSNLFGRYVYAGRLAEAERLLQGSQFAFYDSYLSLARAWLEQGRTDKARTFGEAALAVNPAKPTVYLLLAEVALREGAVPQASALLRRGLEKSPGHLELRRQLAALEGKMRTASPQQSWGGR